MSHALPDPLDRAHPPLVALLAAAKENFVTDFAARLHRTDHAGLTLSHSANVLRWLHSGPATSTRLVSLSGVSKQAISQQVAQLATLGYVDMVRHPDDGRAQLVRLTAKGVAAQKTVHRLFAEIERDWEADLGPEAWAPFLDGLRHAAGAPDRLDP